MLVLFAPPIALLLFGLATRWAFRGFDAGGEYPKIDRGFMPATEEKQKARSI